MPGKDPVTYDIDEVCIWITAIGLGSKVDVFRENAVDGDMLLSLTAEDFVDPLGLTSLQAKKIKRSLEFTKQLANESGGGGGEEAASKIKALEEINEYLKNENAALKMQLQEFQNAKARPPAAAPAPPPKPAPAPQRKEHHVIKGAAGGAAKGALLGVIGGAIAGDPGKGAKIGAAVGAAGGGMQGMGARRRARLRR